MDSGSIWVADIRDFQSRNGKSSSILRNGCRMRRAPWLSKSQVVVVVRSVNKQKAARSQHCGDAKFRLAKKQG